MTTTKLFIKYIIQVSIVIGAIGLSFFSEIPCMFYEAIPGINNVYYKLMSMEYHYHILFGILGAIWLLLVGIKAYRLYGPAVTEDLNTSDTKTIK